MSESNKFTPGPWFHHGPSGSEHTAGGFIKSSDDRNSSPLICSIYGTGGQPHKANANLIAAAPDLLEALEQMIDEYGTAGDGWPRNNKVLRDARTAISKARGQQ